MSNADARRIVVAGGGAAGFFAAIACARADRAHDVAILEKGPHFLTKVRISGGGRCNVTHDCSDSRELSTRYPRGARALIAPFHRFDASDTMEWFQSRGVPLKIETDGRIFPVSDSSETFIDCLTNEAKNCGVKMHTRRGVANARRNDRGGFDLTLADGESIFCDRLCLATGGSRSAGGAEIARSLGHSLESAVPSLFTFHIDTPWLRALPGVSVEMVEVSVPNTHLRECGPLLVTHSGLSGPAILRLSAWGARILHGMDYRFPLHVNWLPEFSSEQIARELQARRDTQSGRLLANVPIAPLPLRLWEKLLGVAGIATGVRCNQLTRADARALTELLHCTEFPVTGKSLNADEFVTCGGVRLREVDWKTMESRICPGLYFAGELLDVDGITGGFNFQAAWTTGWIAGNAMAQDGAPI